MTSCSLTPGGVRLAAGPLAEEDPECPGCHVVASEHPEVAALDAPEGTQTEGRDDE